MSNHVTDNQMYLLIELVQGLLMTVTMIYLLLIYLHNPLTYTIDITLVKSNKRKKFDNFTLIFLRFQGKYNKKKYIFLVFAKPTMYINAKFPKGNLFFLAEFV